MTVKNRTNLTPEAWGEIKTMICSGVGAIQVSKLFSIGIDTIYGRANRENWPTPGRRAKAMRAARAAEGPVSSEIQPQISNFETQSVPSPKEKAEKPGNVAFLGSEDGKCDVSIQQSLLSLIEAPPETFQLEFGKVMQRLIAEGVPNIEPPRNINELKTIAALWSKASGLDAKASGPTNAPLVNPMRTVTRRSSGTVVEVDGIEDFEV